MSFLYILFRKITRGDPMKPNEQKKQQDQSPKKKEELSKRDLDELMGRFTPTYKRHKGALRQK